MNSKTDLWIDSRREEMIAALQKLITFKSVSCHSGAPGEPFGPECKKALDHTLALCEDMGFKAVDMEGYIGYADYGCGEETLGILTHLDVVPEGEGWTKAGPYEGKVIDNWMVGRGTLDDKGPAIASIYALAAVKEAGYDFRRRVRLIFGCDEESGMGCLTHYMEHEKIPDMAFSPDAEYPLVNSEKNIYHGTFAYAYPSVISIKAGTVVNAVPGFAESFVPCSLDEVQAAMAGKEGFEAKAAEGGVSILATGCAAHASMPECGKNAIQMMVSLLCELPLPEADLAALKAIKAAYGMEYNGESVGLDKADESGRLTLNIGLMDWNEQGYSLSIDIRAPISVTFEEIREKLAAALPMTTPRDESFSPGHFVPEDSELVSGLLKVYRERTGDMSAPKRIGGGTYARHFDTAVAFGVEREYRENRLHMVDEALNMDDFIEDAKLMADAIIQLACAK
ncbi:MAG: Sapep family Mn(2+)-dependent dipeptidase [Clostridia bacterium]|nr:Sapep family Mn(2+)-dependent dipeptidase [Clostridia bacterium]